MMSTQDDSLYRSERTQALVIKVTIKQIMGKRDHQGDREYGKWRFVPHDQGLLYLSLTIQYVHKKN